MVFIIRRKGESKDSMFRKFTRSFIDEEIVDEVKKKLYYKKPSLLRQEEEKERKKNRGKKRFTFNKRPFTFIRK
jgi:ribosomal protein S21